MHFMIGRIFMNQENKVINVHLEKRESKDYLVFGFEEIAEVCLNDDESQNNLKSIFVKLLVQLTKHPVELQFLENPEYKCELPVIFPPKEKRTKIKTKKKHQDEI